jgi:tungstate transport system substrate-binding protein
MFKLSRWGKRIGLLALILILPQLGWANNHAGSKQDAQPTSEGVRLRLATTTSTENSGLLAHLLPPFEKKYGVKVDVVAVGTGQALQIGRNGDADVVMVHAPALEKKFVEEGYGIERIYFMYNDFVILGPESDPANIRKLETAKEAFAAIAQQNALFVSRGDNSGTHVKERGLWAEAGVDPSTRCPTVEPGCRMLQKIH